MDEKFFTTGLINLNYVESSSTERPILLLHGLFTRWQAFNSIIPELARQGHVFAVDLRGHGKSGQAETYRIQDFVDDVADFIKHCIKEPVIIFGHSLGGMVSIMLAAEHPELVKALILGDPLLSSEYFREFAESNKDRTTFWRDLAQTKSVDFILSELKKELIPIPNQKELVPAATVFGEDHPSFKFSAECFSKTDPNMIEANNGYVEDTYAEYKIDSLLPQIQCPVLILQANPLFGGLVKDEHIKKALSLLPDARNIKFNNLGHYLHMQDREAVLKVIVPFISALS